MSDEPLLSVEPWSLRERALDLDALARTETLFALSNGHVGLRGNLDEGEPHIIPGTYLNGFYESRPLPYAEAGYGYPEAGQTVVDVTNGKVIRLMVDDEVLDVRYGELLAHERELDLRAGTLRRQVRWRSPSGREVEISSTRLVSFWQRSVAAVRYEVRPVGDDARVVIQSELVANEPVPEQSKDPRAAAALAEPLVAEQDMTHELRAMLIHSTERSGLRIAAAMDHLIDGPDGTVCSVESTADLGRLTVAAELDEGESLVVTKYVAYGWSAHRSLPSIRDQVDAALASARHAGFDELLEHQRDFLDDFWSRADVEIDGDPELQQAIRYAIFQALQSSVRAERRAIPAKGLTGPGYDGHTFWDAETFTLPVLTYTAPSAAADALRWRHSTLDMARERAATLGFKGAAFPWRTIEGQECSAYWPAGTAGFHVSADIADAVIRHIEVTGDCEFERDYGLELLVETARLWRSLGSTGPQGNFHIDGVTGPDEYTALVDDNAYTNLMAQRNMLGAAEAVERHPAESEALGVTEDEVKSWRRAAERIWIPFDEDLGVHPQDDNFTRHRRWEFRSDSDENYPMLLHYPYFVLYRSQVVKQADLVLALYKRGDAFTAEEKARDFDYYEAITVRDSSLSVTPQGIIAAEVGHLDLAFDYFAEAVLTDISDIHGNTGDGVHLAALASSWLIVVAGFGGMRDIGGRIEFAPRLPHSLRRIAFRLTYCETLLRVEIVAGEARYEHVSGPPLELRHYGELIELEPGETVAREWSPPDPGPPPTQPPGREPSRPPRNGL
ncbi:glycoside hydrolase family 65 protein [Thermoleophilia bacterium SCSIO 60948]|nr:glycoside hydrolase family 65 protein [Thermoleophilia bacterium SCSIO 60948]